MERVSRARVGLEERLSARLSLIDSYAKVGGKGQARRSGADRVQVGSCADCGHDRDRGGNGFGVIGGRRCGSCGGFLALCLLLVGIRE